jgi:hypothetical protein
VQVFDWCAIALVLAALYALGSRKRVGFVLLTGAALGSACAAFPWDWRTPAPMVLDAGLLALAIRGFVRWRTAPSPA